MMANMNRVEQLEAQVDELEQVLAEIAGLAAYPKHEAQVRLARVRQLAVETLWRDEDGQY